MNPILLLLLLELLKKRPGQEDEPSPQPELDAGGRLIPIPGGTPIHPLGPLGISPFGQFVFSQNSGGGGPVIQGPLTNFQSNQFGSKLGHLSSGSLSQSISPLTSGGLLGGF